MRQEIRLGSTGDGDDDISTVPSGPQVLDEIERAHPVIGIRPGLALRRVQNGSREDREQRKSIYSVESSWIPIRKERRKSALPPSKFEPSCTLFAIGKISPLHSGREVRGEMPPTRMERRRHREKGREKERGEIGKSASDIC